MSDRPWWATAAQWTLWALIMTAVMAWLGRSRFRSRPAAERPQLRHPPSTLIIGLVCFGIFAALAVISNVIPNETTTWWTTAIFVGFAALSVPLILDYIMARHEVSDEGLTYTTWSGRRRLLRWSQLARVRFAAGMKWFRLEDTQGSVARLSVMLMGLPELARRLLAHAPPQAIDAHTHSILKATAEGRPPSVWA
jgi:hypothetical protein